MININIKQHQATILALATNLKDVRVIGLLVFLAIVLLVSWSGVKAIDTNYRLQKQISQLQQQNAVQRLGNENLKLQNDYYNTPQYLELAARHDFGLAAPGETELMVPHDVALAHTVSVAQPTTATAAKAAGKRPAWQRNLSAWLDFLLHRAPPSD